MPPVSPRKPRNKLLQGQVSFEEMLTTRSAATYADFLLPHLRDGFRLLDAGCGSGSIAVGLAGSVGRIVGVDPDEDAFGDAQRHAAEHGIENVEFRVGDIYALEFPDATFDACLCHSMLETLERPLDGLLEIKRVLEPGGVVGVACVEYGGLILAGPRVEVLRRFYALRERLWLLDGHADPYRGRELRGLLTQAGFDPVEATSKYICYGTPEEARSFGAARAADCSDTWYRRDALKHRLATVEDLDAMREAWLAWSTSADAYAAFAWCRALGWKPG
jgi:SAM-dependent methyltransferase